MTEWTERAGAFPLGRKPYEIFAGSRRKSTDPADETAVALNTRPKVVVSRLLEKVDRSQGVAAASRVSRRTLMRRILRTLAILLAAYVVLALAIGGVIGMLQPAFGPEGAQGILRTFDQNGRVHETRLAVIDDGGTLWIQSAQHFRGWYDRLLLNPEVELLRNADVRAYRAVPLDTPETESGVSNLLKQRGTFRFYLFRALLLFADVKPVRLDPAGTEPKAE